MVQRRWERDAARIRSSAPAWADAERWPWWIPALLGLLFAAQGVNLLMEDGTAIWQRAAAVGLLLLVVPAQFIAARRRWRGQPLWPKDESQ